MAKTTFVDGNPQQGIQGTQVLAAFLNKIFGPTGHRHDGLDQDGSASLDYAADTGAVNAYAIALSSPLTAHIVGMPIRFKAANTNSGASTIAINALAAVAIKVLSGNGTLMDLRAGHIKAGGIYTLVYDGAYYLLLNPSFIFRGALVSRTANKSIANSTSVLVDWDAEIYDTENIHDNVVNNSRLTIPAGVTRVRVSTQQIWSPLAGGLRSCEILKNGVQNSPRVITEVSANGLVTSGVTTAISPIVNVAAGDYFEVSVYQTSGGALDFLATTTYFSIEIIE